MENKTTIQKYLDTREKSMKSIQDGKVSAYEAIYKIRQMRTKLLSQEKKMLKETWEEARRSLMISTISGEEKSFEQYYQDTYGK